MSPLASLYLGKDKDFTVYRKRGIPTANLDMTKRRIFVPSGN
jgi:hypothetical protein